jgi:hypothetical protein
MTTSALLKPCPFCGDDVEVSESDDALSGIGRWTIQCRNCLVEMSEGYLLELYHKGDKPKRLNQIHNRWNGRSALCTTIL